MLIYRLLDIFFLVFHSAFILFILFGWIFPKTRRANLIAIALTAISWFGLGIFYGIGFCFCTEWHWQVRMKLGDYSMPASYTKFLADSITGLDFNATLIDAITGIGFFLALTCSLITNFSKRS